MRLPKPKGWKRCRRILLKKAKACMGLASMVPPRFRSLKIFEFCGKI